MRSCKPVCTLAILSNACDMMGALRFWTILSQLLLCCCKRTSWFLWGLAFLCKHLLQVHMATVCVHLQAQACTVCDYCRCTSLLCVYACQALGVSTICVYCRFMCLLFVSTAGSHVYWRCAMQGHMSTWTLATRVYPGMPCARSRPGASTIFVFVLILHFHTFAFPHICISTCLQLHTNLRVLPICTCPQFGQSCCVCLFVSWGVLRQPFLDSFLQSCQHFMRQNLLPCCCNINIPQLRTVCIIMISATCRVYSLGLGFRVNILQYKEL